MRRATLVALVMVIGSALTWLLLLDAPAAPAAVAPAPPAAVAASDATTVTQPALDPRVGGLLAMNDALDARLAQLESDVSGAAPEVATTAEGPDQARRRSSEELRASYERLIEQHEASPFDPTWAHASSATLDRDLSTIAGEIEGASLDRIDCRSSSCIARMTLRSIESARGEAARLVRSEYGLNCATQIQLEDATDAQAPYELRIVFHSCQSDA